MASDVVVDASALVSIILKEPPEPAIKLQLAKARAPVMSASTLFETFLASTRTSVADPRRSVELLVAEFGITVVDFDSSQASTAYSAFLRFGKGRHPAALNFGDCMVYALAAKYNAPILCTGDDFAKTDIKVADY